MKGKVKFHRPPRNRRELLASYEHVINTVKNWTEEEFMASLVRAGIYTRNGKLRKEYGG